MESKSINAFSKWNLLTRDSMIGYLIIEIALYLAILSGMVIFPEIRKLMAYNVILGIFGLLTVICVFFIVKKWRKISRIIKNGKIIKTEIIKIENVTRDFRLHAGEIYISSFYLDEKQKRKFFFESFCDGTVASPDNWKNDFKNVKFIDVYINQCDYSEYVMLCKEALETDEIRNTKMNFILGVLAVIIMIFVVLAIIDML